ncbi:MAG TPA: hypothetical protein VMS11_00115 [Solirubrobacterales bacterium]|nr:hypothetical protein [Solirubrobacterales bacterium]
MSAALASALAVVALVLLSAGTAFGDPDTSLPVVEHSQAEIRQAEEGATVTDPQAAAELPHIGLGREEALDLMEGVFGRLLQEPAGVFDDLRVRKFLSDNVAVIAPGDEPAVLGDDAGEGAPAFGGATLLESSIPLRTEPFLGDAGVVDLSLEHAEGELQPANPLVDVGIPDELGEGIELPGAGVRIEIEGAPAERAPSLSEGTVAFYPNVAEETDLAISPTPTGVETLSQLRSADAPRTQTLRLALPAGADLLATEDGGAEATLGDETLLKVLPPTAIDANGQAVPVSLEVSGSSLAVEAHPDQSTTFPVAVDPVIEDLYHWESGVEGWQGWAPYRTPTSQITNQYVQPEHGCSTYCYLSVGANAWNWTYTNAQTYWNYAVPRFQEDFEKTGTRPTSWVACFTVGGMVFRGQGDYQSSPAELFAVSNEAGAWVSANLFPPDQTGTYSVCENTNHSGKMAAFGLFATGNTSLGNSRYILAGYSQILLGDEDVPKLGAVSPGAGWVNTQPGSVSVTATDSGLGVAAVQVNAPNNGPLLGTTPVKSSGGPACTGTNRAVCPRTWQGSQVGNVVNYDPSTLPQGTNNLALTAVDPTGNRSQAVTLQVKVDHTAPALALSGTMTEQATLGTTLPQYTLRTEAKDGTEAAPQSGIVSTEVKVDGKVVTSGSGWAPGCATQSCALTKDLTLKASEYSAGKHTVEVLTTDGVGLKSAPKVLSIELQPDTISPTVNGSGGLISGPAGWIEQKSYAIQGVAEDPKGYGVTKLQLKVDSSLVGSATGTCSAGNCTLTKTFTVNAATYGGGEHEVSLVATDGAGNPAERRWTIYIDPKGQITTSEATATLEALEETTDAAPVAPFEAEGAEGGGITLTEGPSGFESEGAPVGVAIGEDPEEGVTIEGSDGAFAIEPVGTAGGATEGDVKNGASVVSGNTAPAVDTISRPLFDGLMTFTAIRDAAAPEEFKWQVELGSGQTLKSINEQLAGIYYADGTEAVLITAELAHDARGSTVPTSLSVIGDEIVLAVHHRTASTVYPVMAGQAIESGYAATVVATPTYEGPSIPGVSPVELTFEGYEYVSPPEPEEGAGASASGVWHEKHFRKILCSHTGEFPGLKLPAPYDYHDYEGRCGNPWTGEQGVLVAFREGLRGRFFQRNPNDKGLAEVRHEGSSTTDIDCKAEGVSTGKAPEHLRGAYSEVCGWWGATADGGGSSAKWGKHITPVSFNMGKSRGWCGDNCGGTPNPWEDVPLPPMVYYLWAAHNNYAFHETRCIDC